MTDAGRAPSPASDTLPDDLSAALDGVPALRDGFLGLPPSHRREYLKYIGEAKRPDTRTRRIERSLAGLRDHDGQSPRRADR